MGVIYVAFEGFEVIAQAGDETIDAKRNIPKAMLYSVLIVTVTYVLVAWIIGPTWVLVGVAVYHFYSKSHAMVADHEIHVFEEAPTPRDDAYRIMVSVANPANTLQIVQNTYKICQAKNASVELLHMVPVPDQVPLSDAEQYMLEGKEGILEAMLYLGPLFPISTHLRYCRSIARGIVSAVRQKRINMLIMGWHGRGGSHVFRLGSTLDPIIERSPCSVVVLEDCGGNRKFKRVLAPLAGGPNGALALEVASILTDQEEGQLTAFTVDNRAGKFDLQTFVDGCKGRMHLPPSRINVKVATAGNVVDSILAEARNYDLVVLGCTRQPILRQIAHNPVPETVAQRCDKPLVMVRAAGGIRSWIRRWI